MGKDAAIEEGMELVLHELRQVGSGDNFGLRKERGGVLLHQALQLGLLRAVALIVDRGEVGRLAGLLHRGLHALLTSRLRCFTVSKRAARRHCP